MRLPRRLLLLLALLPPPLHAQEAAVDACAPRLYRWQEDCRALAARRASLEGLDSLRYLPLTDTGSAWLTLGGEYRLKIESLADPSFGIRGAQAYTATGQRFLAHADLRTLAGPRLFVQLAAATDTGRKPAERPFDRSAADLAQGFIDLPFNVRDTWGLLRIGRQELDLGGNRLVAVRDAANLRRAFDLALLSVNADPLAADVFAGHPVRNRIGAFDDDATPGEQFWGARLRTIARADIPTGELFFFGRTRDRAIFQDAVGRELRRTFGARLSGRRGGFDYAAQASLQRGDAARKEIRASAAAGDFGYQPGDAWQSRIGISMGAASGARTAGDGQLNTFDVIYPNLGYFTDAPLTYPGNNWDVQPNVAFAPWRTVRMQAGVDVLYRLSRNDAVYEPPGLPLIRGTGQGSRFITALSFVKIGWRASPRFELSASYVHASVGSLVRDQQGHAADYGVIQATLRL